MNRRRNGLRSFIIKTGGLCLCGLLLFQLKARCQSLEDLFLQAVFPAAGYDDDRDITHFISEGAALVQSCLLPGAAYINEQEKKSRNTVSELYPSQADLEALCEENSQYESLEALAESKLMEAKETQPADNEAKPAASSSVSGTVYPMSSLLDYNFLINNFYVVDSSTACDSSVLNPEELLNKDLTMDLTGDDPKILIYHTHSQEAFKDSVPGEEAGTVVGLGTTLTNILQEKYGISVYHDKGVYDMIDGRLDRSEAYSMALPVVEDILAKNPSIKVVIDLHRDGVNEDTHLVTTVNGKPTAKVMFFNGLCRSATSGTNGYIQNPYLSDNLAFSLKMQLKAAEKYPDLTRRIYLRSYRFNMHVMPRTLLIECGAQTNTVEEVQNAMEPLADVLYSVLSGT